MCVAVNGTWDVPSQEMLKLMHDSLEEHVLGFWYWVFKDLIAVRL